MNDRELLEKAAKAAGAEYFSGGDDWENPINTEDREFYMLVGEFWNPLKYDGDAFRLAVQLQIDVNHQRALGVVEAFWSKDAGCKREPCGSDSLAATRRAIVRAAAAIGESGHE
jgi:hypothetical protein